MAGLLSHGLAAMAFCAFLAWLIGLPAISYGVFAAGFFAMLIELDFDELSPNNRTPITHSIFFGFIWVVIFAIAVWGISGLGIIPSVYATQLTLAMISAYTTHLLIDSFTKEGIYTFPKGLCLKRWIKRLSKGDKKCWVYWLIFENKRFKKWIRSNDDPILNACISLPSLLVIIVFVAMMPLPT